MAAAHRREDRDMDSRERRRHELLFNNPGYASSDLSVKSLATVVGSSSICSGFFRKALTPARQASRSQSLAESMMIGVRRRRFIPPHPRFHSQPFHSRK